MKRLILITCILAAVISGFCQAPKAFKYQAVVRDHEGLPLEEQVISIQIEILSGSPEGMAVYSETHDVESNTIGLINLDVGKGTTTDDFSAISWSASEHFMRISIDTEGGSNYMLMGVTQLLSVPYALHAGLSDSTRNESQILEIDGNILSISSGNSVTIPTTVATGGGNTLLALFGDITDAEAAQKIEAEAGPFTSHVWIENTSSLSSLDLSGLKSLVELKIRNNDALTTLNLGGLQNCKSIRIEQNPILHQCDLSSLIISEYTRINNNESLQELNLELAYTTSLRIYDNPLLGEPGLANLVADEVFIAQCGFERLDLSGLTKDASITVAGCPDLGELLLPNIVEDISLTITFCPELNKFEIPTLKSSEYILISDCQTLTNIDVGGLDTIIDMGIKNCPVQDISLSDLRKCRILNISFCPLLTSIEASRLEDFRELYFNYNALSSNEVDKFLRQFAEISPPIQHKTIYLNNQTPPAPPINSLDYKQQLLDNLNNVITD